MSKYPNIHFGHLDIWIFGHLDILLGGRAALWRSGGITNAAEQGWYRAGKASIVANMGWWGGL